MKKQGPGWRRLPFLKILTALVVGILLEYYVEPGIRTWFVMLSISLLLLALFFFIPYFGRFRLLFISGIAGLCAFISAGGILLNERNVFNNEYWFGLKDLTNPVFEVLVEEPPVEKTSTFRYLATVLAIHSPGGSAITAGRIFIYIKKDSSLPQHSLPGYGTRLLFKKLPEPIRGSGNPGGFDFGLYCRMKGISHQVFTSYNELYFLKEKKTRWLKEVVFHLRKWVLKILRKNLNGEKELGLAEALLIGYKQDLDKSLVKDYSDTGVVHIIALSGLHVGLIYWLLGILLLPLHRLGLGWIAAIITVAGLWLFSFMGGAQPSLLRAALMFSCMVIEKRVSGKGVTYNTIAFSAFVLLCIDPRWLWDAGFQLSYAAVISIIAFMKPVYAFLYFRNKILDMIWKMNAVTIAAQLLTFPVCIYYFHQFPVYFLLTNFIAVPLSTLILFGEILLLLLSFLPLIAKYLGKIIEWMIGLMNDCISLAAGWPFASWESLSFSPAQALILTAFSLTAGFGWIDRSKSLLKISLFNLALFAILRLISFHQAAKQEILIVYNTTRMQAIDLVSGRKSIFTGDSILREKSPQREFFLDDSRTYFRTSPGNDQMEENYFLFGGRRVWLVEDSHNYKRPPPSQEVDLLILSGNPRLYFSYFAKNLRIKQVVIDGSVPAWKSGYWKKDCDSLGIPWHDVTTHGAFVMRIR